MIENAALAAIFAILAPFLVSLVQRWHWSPQRVQVTVYSVALVFAVAAVYLDAGTIAWEALDIETVLGYFAAILVLAEGLYIFLLKPTPGSMATGARGLLQVVNEFMLAIGGSPKSPGGGPPATGADDALPGG